ncbi:MAG: beta strand repeat-containing protein [Ilumatobacteraceae bacterium]
MQTLTASAALATVTVNNFGTSQLAVTSATARNNVTVTAVSAMQVATATSTLNNVSLTTSGTGSNLTVGAISAPIGVVTLDSSADIAQGTLTGTVSATGARLRAVGSATLRTAVGTLGATAGSGLALTETDAITLGETGAGVPPAFARVQSTAGSVSVVAGDAISALVVAAPQGDVSLTSTNAGIAVDSITAGTTAGIATLLAAQSITDNDGLVDITAFRAVVTSTAGSIGATNDPLDLTVSELVATASAGSVDVSETDGLVVAGLTATSASLAVAGSVTQTGTINAATLAVRTTAPASTVSLVNPANSVGSISGSTAAGTFGFVNAGDLTVIAPGIVAGTAAAGDGNIQLTSQNGNLTIVSNLTAQNDVVTLNAVNGTISQQVGSVIDAGLLQWNARSATFNGTIPATVVGPPQPGQTQIGPAVPGQTLVVTAGTYIGDLVIVNSGNIQLDGVVTATGTITVTSQTAGIAFGAAGRLDGTSVSLNAVTASQLVVGGGVPVSAIVSAGSLSLSSPGCLRQTVAITGSGLSATAGSGAIAIDNPSNSVGAFSASAPHAGGNVVFVNATGFSVAAPGITAGTATVGDGFVSLWAVSGDLTVAAPIEAPGDVVQLRAGGTVVVSAQINAQSRVIIDSSGVSAEPIPVSTGQAFVDSVALINSLPPIVGGYQIVVTSSLVLPQTLTFRNTIAVSGAAGVVVDGGGVLANGIVVDTDPQDPTKTGSFSRITNLAFANFTGAAVSVNGAQNVAIQGLTVTDSATGLLLNGIVNGTTVRGSTFRNVQTAMQLTGAQRATIGGTGTSQRNRIEGASRAGVLATGFCTGTRIIGTTFTANPRTRTQFNVRSSRGLRISGTSVERAPRVVRTPTGGSPLPISLFGR